MCIRDSYGLCPLAVWESGANGHIEPLLVLSLVMAARALKEERSTAAGIWLGAAALVKLVPLILLPPLLLHRRGRIAAAVASLVFAAAWFPFTLHGVDVTRGLRAYLAHWSFNSPVHALLRGLGGPEALLRALPFAVAVLAGLVLARRGRNAVHAWPRVLFLFLVTGPTLHPWYALWILPLSLIHISEPTRPY